MLLERTDGDKAKDSGIFFSNFDTNPITNQTQKLIPQNIILNYKA